ncbi:PREDICTED: E3 ubiquitin-protein ligase PRT6 isoform X2 [Nelumbo nucifera]|uniref:E3 ubiquitin-protein ligase n=1 Tax=Nelumbo nucifera TaxID=4432 RepID=A0A1U7ZTP2_NELNU|nr:PREDICTED: E3 ubiquitin-protein ligase PRT6 isoform X2 [Nelumbo nucifera]
MEVDSPMEPNYLSPQDRILQRLLRCGVPAEQLDQLQPGLVALVKVNKSYITELVNAILPSDVKVVEALSESKTKAGEASRGSSIKNQFQESMSWLQWLMFEGEPHSSLESLANMSSGQRGVCGAVWGQNDIAYRCRTCENDPTCAICVPCFQNGNHKDHDYSIIYTGGGCCDCGDVTAWKREGFCSKHKGTEQIQPVPEEIANSAGPILDALLLCWKDKLLSGEASLQGTPRVGGHVDVCKMFGNELTLAIVEMLLEFCKYSESLLGFVSKRVFSLVGLLDVLVRAERFLDDESVVKKLHELLLKLLGEPNFKYEFAKVFINYYPAIINEAVKECSDTVLVKYPLLAVFSVQIFTVSTLTPNLVKEVNLLGMLLGCLGEVFVSCSGEDGQLQVSQWANLHETTFRLVEDTRYVMNHNEVPKYITREKPDVLTTWMKLLAFVQGMNPQKRVTGLHIEEENENVNLPFVLGHSIANIHSLFVAGAFSDDAREMDRPLSYMNKEDLDDNDGVQHPKVGLSQESSVCSTTGRNSTMDQMLKWGKVKVDTGSLISVPPPVSWLTFECLKAIENWLRHSVRSGIYLSSLSPDTETCTGSSLLSLRKTFSRIRKGKNIFYRTPTYRNRFTTSSEIYARHNSSPFYSGFPRSVDLENEQAGVQGHDMMDTSERDPENSSSGRDIDEDILEADHTMELESLHVLSLSDWPDIVYDVSSQDVTAHIPLHRLLSLLIQKALRKCYGESRDQDNANASNIFQLPRPDHDFFGHFLGGCHPYGFSAVIMEHPLRIRVFCAQVCAGMWRKNGDAAMFSFDWYNSVRWSDQGLELDLFLLQCCAALAPPDPYVKRILERFGLSSYLSLNLERSNEYEPLLVQAMFTLIIQIVKERRFCGMSAAESLRRELIYNLSIGDATHSQIVKSLPRDLSKNDQLQNILDSTAVYFKPSGMKQGKYSLRKTYWKELDLYHPRWNLRDLQFAEERYLRFCKASALTVQVPRWTKIYPPLSGVSRIATSKTVLQIVRAVLYYAVFTDKISASRAPDGVLLTALHLLSLALDICYKQKQSGDQPLMSVSSHMEDPLPVLAFATEVIDLGTTKGSESWSHQTMLSLLVSVMRMHQKESLHNFMEAGHCNLSSFVDGLLKKFAELDAGCMTELQRLAPEVVCQLSQPIPDSRINIGSASEAEERKAKARERQAAILEKMRAAQSKFMENLYSTASDAMDVSKSDEKLSVSDDGYTSEELAPVICSLCRDPDSKSPVSYLIFLQKSRLASFVERGPPSWEQVHESDKHCHIAKNEDEVNESAFDVQSSEADAFMDFIKARLLAPRNIQQPSTSHDTNMSSASSLEMMEEEVYNSIQRDACTILSYPKVMEGDQHFSTSHAGHLTRSRYAESPLLAKYIASLSTEASETTAASRKAHSHNENSFTMSTVYLAAFDGFGPSDCDGIHISSCGHAVHQECRERYLSSLRERYLRRIVFEGGHIVDLDQGEFLCPVCRRLANSVLPTFPDYRGNVRERMMSSNLSSTETAGLSIISCLETNVLLIQQALSLLQSAANMVGKSNTVKAFSSQRGKRMRPTLEPVFNSLCKMYSPDGHDKFSASGRVIHSMILWDTLKYALISAEIAARGGRSYMHAGSSTPGLIPLYNELESSTRFILSLLLQVVQRTRSDNFLQVLLRFRGVQLMAESICSGVSIDEFSASSGSRRGSMSSILKHVDKRVPYPDIQFWKRAADPVLAHDPFSSLMWVLFCLPSPFLTSVESFLSLVHLFYVVCIIQAIITCHGNLNVDISQLAKGNCLVSDLCKIKGESVVVQDYFVSNYIDLSCHPKDMVRRFSSPYLRRCALLWKLLSSSMPTPFSDRSHGLGALSSHVNNDALESTSGFLLELKEVEELENMFKIPSLDVVFRDEMLHVLGVKWLSHFCKEFQGCRYGRSLHSTPAVPFKLMNLPHVYQDLLQRYIKRQCPDCGGVQDDPALCLLCGRLCCPAWKQCCRERTCQTHAISCGAGFGVFLLIRKTTILLQRNARQSFWPSPYLDAFGEEDHEIVRGKPLYLSEERYSALTYMVASHGLDRSSEVLRQTTIDIPFII